MEFFLGKSDKSILEQCLNQNIDIDKNLAEIFENCRNSINFLYDENILNADSKISAYEKLFSIIKSSINK